MGIMDVRIKYLFKIREQTPFFEQYVIDNYDKIQQLLHSGVDFD